VKTEAPFFSFLRIQRHLSRFVVFAAFFSFITIGAQATPGGLDLTFGHVGISYDYVSGYSMTPEAIVRKPNDGTILVAGTAIPQNSPDQPKLLLRHYSSDGILDSNFGSNGFGVAPMGPYFYTLINGEASDVLVLADGRIIVAGWNSVYTNGNYVFKSLVWRFNSNGVLDTTFGNNGSVTISSKSELNLRLTFSNGKILILDENHLTRLNLDGTFDGYFGYFGSLTIPPPTADDAFLGNTVAVASNGDILIGGQVQIANDQQPWIPAIIRYTSSGAPVTAFGSCQSGWPYGIAFGQLPCAANGEGFETSPYTSLAIQPDGKILAGGVESGNAAILGRHNAWDGSLDPNFGIGGEALSCNTHGIGRYVGLQSTGKIGLLTNRELLSTFSNGALNFAINDPYSNYDFQDMFIQPSDDKFVVVSASTNFTSPNNEIILARYMP
jgi:uncharacterized delta-60 repeat protein